MYKYDICILAHPADAGDAGRLAAGIRAYRLPRHVKPADGAGGCRSILPDSGGGAFDPEAAERLDECRQLIVLCSPDSRDYEPIREKLLYFEEKRGRQSIIAVIVRGEPVEAFPPFFIEKKLVPHILPDGSVEQRMETQEPVASDLRGSTPARRKALLRYETVRIVASLLGLEPDALERRHARRARRRRAVTAAVAAALCLCVGAVFLYFSGVARDEGRIADSMTAMSDMVIERLTKELPERFADDPDALEYVQQTVDEALALYATGGTAGEGG